ncbi:uncharacterized protein N7469_010243 [Penicillium citrinum]|uniref:Tyrosine specific protein phosphatases domain-containing protein n=1 Tax=Penicillium citrinum TaxID=5077 RepID=A0A9W9NJW4_PENCI|nr:uncharacterized protein N7469_010243 [Penicillium citrinum]KAJ5221356.1 hypothetical protein N7469_010243 [Penicillium citrinum]
MIDTENLREVLDTDIKTPIPETTVSKIISLPPFIAVPGVTNFRDLSQDEKLRPGERLRAPSPEIKGIVTIWMPYGTRPASLDLRDFVGEDGSATGFVKMYTGILNAAQPAFTQVFSHIRDQPDDPFVFHCSAGKDRTGVLAALILLLIGRSHDAIINDYILTRVSLENVRENLTEALALQVGTDHLSPEAKGMLELSGVRANAMAAFLKTFENNYKGGAEEFLTTKLGFTSEDIQTIRYNLTSYN